MEIQKNYTPLFYKVTQAEGGLSFVNKILSIEGIKDLCEALKLNNKVNRLNLSNNNIGKEECRLISELLRTNTSITELDLSKNMIEEKGIKKLLEGIEFIFTLKKINLSDNNFNGYIEEFSEYLCYNETIEELDLSGNFLNEDGIFLVSQSLITNKKIKIMKLSDNRIGNYGMKYISESLKINKVIEEIDLSSNRIDEEGAEYLSEMLESNDTLNLIDFSFNEINSQGAYCIVESLKNNYNLKKIIIFNQKNCDSNFNFDIQFMIQCNQIWNPEIHRILSPLIKRIIILFVFCLRDLQKRNKLKIPKFVLFEILKKIDRKSFFNLWKQDQYYPKINELF